MQYIMGLKSRARNWCLTDFELLDWKALYDASKDRIRYIVVGDEICPDTKKQHYQVFIQFFNATYGTWIKKNLAPKAHIEVCRGSPQDNETYCKKDGKILEFGEISYSGKRTDLEKIVREMKEGKNIVEIAMTYPKEYCGYRNGLKDIAGYILEKSSKEFRELDVHCYIGKAGCGKTRKAIEENPDYYKLCQDADTIWWDGYHGQSVLIIDDFYGWIKYGQLLTILDGYQLRLPTKGSHTYAKWNKVIITSNDDPATWYARGLTPALARRITGGYTYFTENGTRWSKGNTGTLDHDEYE